MVAPTEPIFISFNPEFQINELQKTTIEFAFIIVKS